MSKNHTHFAKVACSSKQFITLSDSVRWPWLWRRFVSKRPEALRSGCARNAKLKGMTHMRFTKHPTSGSTYTAASQDMSVPIRQFACSRTHGSSARRISFRTDTLYLKVTRSRFTSHDKKIVIIGALSGLFSCDFSQHQTQ